MMPSSRIRRLFPLLLLAAVFSLSISSSDVRAAGTANWSLEILPVCGNGIIESGEQCDGATLGGVSCQSRGFASGDLACLSDCSGFDTSACVPRSGASGGGGTANQPNHPAMTAITVSGWALPYATVSFLKDGQVAARSVAGGDAAFSLTVSGFSEGTYVFGVQAEDSKGRMTSMTTFSSNLVSGTLSYASNIFLSPTLSIEKESITNGETTTVSGFSVPGAELILATYPDKQTQKSVQVSNDGSFSFRINPLDWGTAQHMLVSQVFLMGMVSDLSRTVELTITEEADVHGSDSGTSEPVVAPTADRPDFNGDSRVDLVDFSILLFWIKKPLDAELLAIEKAAFNGDGKIDLIDFSIMAYAWTG